MKLFILMIVSLLIGFLISIFGNIQIMGMDGGVLVNASYQYFLGYSPYVDIITAVPPAFLIGGKLAYNIWGVNWNSLVLIAAYFSAAVFLLHSLILYKTGFGKILSVLIALYCQSMVMITLSYWWYGRITLIAAQLFISSAILFYRKPKLIFSKLVFLFTTALLLLMKVNIAAVAIFLVYLFFALTDLKHRQLVIKIFLLSFLLALIILSFFSINPLAMLENYLTASPRAFSVISWARHLYFNYPWEVQETLILAIPGMIAFAIVIRSLKLTSLDNKKKLAVFILPFISIISGAIGKLTNNDLAMADGSLIVVGAVYIIKFWENKTTDIHLKKVVSGLTLASIMLFIISGIWKGYSRYNLTETSLEAAKLGLANFYDGETNKRPLSRFTEPSFFETLNASERFLKVNQQIKLILSTTGDQNIKLKDFVFFGPRIDFSYALYSIKPPKGLPLWWEAFSLVNSEKSKLMIQRFMDKKFKLAIFLYHDYTFFPQRLIDDLNTNYEVYDYQDLTVHVLRGEKSMDKVKTLLKRANLT